MVVGIAIFINKLVNPDNYIEVEATIQNIQKVSEYE